jgi:DNA (cytosine-5)-methyltransferase 1
MAGRAYYNEADPKTAAWLRRRIASGDIAPGDVDERSITDVQPDDLRGYTQVHLFAGIGGWSYATRLAGIADDQPIWTGSCPCQPFSVAGQGRGTDDERHLWPEFRRLVDECRPPAVFGEQVAGPAGVAWLDAVRTDLEKLRYAVGASDLCAAGVGAPHRRQRIYFVGLADTERTRLERHARHGDHGDQPGWVDAHAAGSVAQSGESGWPCPDNGGWNTADWLRCRDGKWRPVEPGSFPLADGIPNRVGRLRGYGNAIVPQVAAVFMAAVLGDVNGD